MAKDMQVIWVEREWKYFCEEGLDKANQLGATGQITFSAQRECSPHGEERAFPAALALSATRLSCGIDAGHQPANA